MIDKFSNQLPFYSNQDNLKKSKICALITVDEIILNINNIIFNKDILKGSELYWKEVKQEIEKL